MKRSIRILAVVMVAVMLCLTLASCGKRLSGKYEIVVGKDGGFLDGITDAIGNATNSKTVYIFSGNKVTVETTLFGNVTTSEAKYEIKDDKITFTYDYSESELEELGLDKDDLKDTKTFEELENGNIKIGGVEFKPVD